MVRRYILSITLADTQDGLKPLYPSVFSSDVSRKCVYINLMKIRAFLLDKYFECEIT